MSKREAPRAPRAPMGYELVPMDRAPIRKGDRLWNFHNRRWEPVPPWWVGVFSADDFIAVARPRAKGRGK